MNTQFVIVARLPDLEAIMKRIRGAFAPEIMWVSVKEEHIRPNLPLSLQVNEGVDAHDYLDTPIVRIGVGLHRSFKEIDQEFLDQLASDFTLVNFRRGPLLSPTLESSLESQQRSWRILEYRVIYEPSCTWLARAQRIYPIAREGDTPSTEAAILLVRGFQSLTLDKETAQQLFPAWASGW